MNKLHASVKSERKNKKIKKNIIYINYYDYLY
jgi:hypothetical protein